MPPAIRWVLGIEKDGIDEIEVCPESSEQKSLDIGVNVVPKPTNARNGLKSFVGTLVVEVGDDDMEESVEDIVGDTSPTTENAVCHRGSEKDAY